MNTLRFVLGDQLSRGLSALRDVDRTRDVVLMAEVHDEATHMRHHKQKIVLVLSAMRHLAQSLREEGLRVDYVQLGDPGNTGSLTGELGRALARHAVDRVVVTEPGEWRVWEMMQSWRRAWGVPVEIREDDRFLCSRDEFARWAKGRKSLRMEFFYRSMRRKTGWLMAGDVPAGGRWNHDRQNRKALSYRTLARMTQERRQEIVQEAEAFLAQACGSPTEGRMPVTWQSTVPKEN